MSPLLPFLLLWTPLQAPSLPVGQDAGDGEEREEIERLEAWPAIPGDRLKAVRTDIQRLRKARTEAMGEAGREALIEVGAAVVPLLLPALGKEKDEEAIERIEGVLNRVTDARHTRLLGREFANRSQRVRTWAMRRVAAFPDPGIRAVAEKALARAAKNEDEEKPDRAEHLAAALAVTSSGSLAGLDRLFLRARKGWGRHGEAMRAALEAVRGPEATEIVAARLAGAGRTNTIAALRLLAGCGDRESAVRHVKSLLSSEDSGIRIAAINALRGIVDGDPPLDRLPVFRAIELANEWKSRV